MASKRFGFAEKADVAQNNAAGLPHGDFDVTITKVKEKKHPKFGTIKLWFDCVVDKSSREDVPAGSSSCFSIPLSQADTIVGPLLKNLVAAVLGVSSKDEKGIAEKVEGNVNDMLEAALNEDGFKDISLRVLARERDTQDGENKYVRYTFEPSGT